MGSATSKGQHFLKSIHVKPASGVDFKAIFDKNDTNKDGVLDGNEATRFIHDVVMSLDAKHLSATFAKYDTNHDGKLDANEAAVFLKDLQTGGTNDQAVLQFFALFSTPKDGGISWESLVAEHRERPQQEPPKDIELKKGIEEELMRRAGIKGTHYNNFNDCPVYGAEGMAEGVPEWEMQEEPMPASVAYQLIHDELETDGKPRLNLATFVTTYMEPEAEKLMMDGMKINAIDIDEYKQTTAIHQRCVNMIAKLFNAPMKPGEKATGTGCLGSSEAIMLAALAMKWRWKEFRQKKGLPFDKPNIVMGANVQVCWHKACKYFEIEAREAAVSPASLVLTAERVAPLIDENTIGVCPILGSTFNGEFEDVKGIHDLISEVNEKQGWQIPIHVDAASGGFIAPFTDPDLVWDFRLPWVKSINVSGHKYGLVYAGIGWALWREKKDLPDDLVFHVNYLGGDQASFTLNFSRSGSHFVGQYYNLIRFGKQGYRAIMLNGMRNAAYLRQSLESTGKFEIIDKGHMPLVAFSLKADANPHRVTVFELQEQLRAHGWIVPAYTCPTGAKELAIMRVVVKQNFSRHLADLLVRDMLSSLEHLAKEHAVLEAAVTAAKAGASFHGTVKHAVRRSVHGNGAGQKGKQAKNGVC